MKDSIYKKWVTFLKILLIFFTFITFVNFWYLYKEENYDKQYTGYTDELSILTERFIRYAGEFVNEGKEESYVELKKVIDEITAILMILERGREDKVGHVLLPPSPANIQIKELAMVADLWAVEKRNADNIINQKNIITDLYQSNKNLTNAIEKIREKYLKIMDILATRKNVSGIDYHVIFDQMFDTHLMVLDIQELLDYEIELAKIEKDLPRLINEFETGTNKLKIKYHGDIVYPIIFETEREFSIIKNHIEEIISTGKNLIKSYESWAQIRLTTPKLLEALIDLKDAYNREISQRILVNPITAFTLSIITFITLLTLMYLMYKEQKYNFKKTEKEIQRLIYELKDLADGNLAIQATMGQGITSAIAEAINYSLSALRSLVNNINQTSEKVSHSVQEVRQVTKELVKAIQYQTDEIEHTSTSMNTMVVSIDQVAINAKQSVQVALNSVEIAHDGAIVVHDTISGMERIRDQIRETEKRMQRLSDRSSEIEEIVSLIDGIADQTNILSINAAIQAAMVGDVGMGFAVVADEVQTLAVKSSKAVKEVEEIVRSIQTDTARAVKGMELAIVEVNNGTKLAHDAGSALSKIESVSKVLADLIQGISKNAAEQAIVSNKISKAMGVIETIARQTAIGTNTTAQSIENLVVLMNVLENSVAEFKLSKS